MSIESMTCNHLTVLKSYLAAFEHKLDSKPNGQNKYTFPDGLVLNVYETGKVVFQGPGANFPFAKQIEAMVNQINAPLSPSI